MKDALKEALMKLKLDMVYRGLSREEAARRYEEIVKSSNQ